jgi:tetratricopeptide (TPR) repeat protein
LRKGVALLPASSELQFNLGYFLEAQGEFAAALEPLQKSVELSQGRNGQFLAELANAYSKTGHFAEAIDAAHRALDLAAQAHDEQLEKNTREALDRYEAARAIARPQ